MMKIKLVLFFGLGLFVVCNIVAFDCGVLSGKCSCTGSQKEASRESTSMWLTSVSYHCLAVSSEETVWWHV